MLLPLKEALLGHPIHNNFFYLIGTFHLQLIENLTNRVLSTWSWFFLIEHVQRHSGPNEDQALCVSPLLFLASASLGIPDNFHVLKSLCPSHSRKEGGQEVFFNPESKGIPGECLLLRRSRSYFWQKKKKVTVFLYKDRFRPLAYILLICSQW